jgi:tetratricopeptide (TPR) repeat protein
VAAALLLAGGGCSEVRGRKLVQEANELYKQGKYADAVARFEEAEALVPALPTLWLNKGYTCRQLIVPGGRDDGSKRAVACALDAFRRLGELRPSDARAEQLTIQTLFDADDFAALEALFVARNRAAPGDVGVVRGLQQVYYRWGKWAQALDWSKRAAALRAGDAEAQYAVGTFVWQVLSTKVEIAGAERASLADEGIAFLEKALALRPRYPEAMTYLGLLYREKSLAFLADVPDRQAAVDKANEWQKRALEARGGKS